jgi:DNA mismatch endonuclease, patch repair protein
MTGDHKRLDPLTPTERSALMSRVRSKGNASTEKRVVNIMRRQKISGWRRHLKLPGTPDFVFSKVRVALFIDGCFWHGCPRCHRQPRSNASYWSKKVARNKARDQRARRKLRNMGWSVLGIWEHALADELAVTARIKRYLSLRPISFKSRK